MRLQILKSQQISFVCIAGVMTTSLSIVSSQSSLAKLFDKQMLQKLYIMIDRVQDKYEDKNIKLQEQLIAMKEEKKELLENMHEMETQLNVSNEKLARMHEMETQLHDSKEALAKHVLEKEL